MTLTDASAALYPLIRDGLDAFADALSMVKQQSERVLKVTTTNAFASKWLVPRLSRWRDARPDIALEVIGTDAVLDLAAGEADLVRYMYAAPSGFIAHELFQMRCGCLCNPGILPGGQPLQSLADLRNHTLVHSYWSPSDTNAPTWQRWLEAASAGVCQCQRLHEMEHLSFREELHAIDAVSNGQGS